MSKTKLHQLQEIGQSVWLDYIHRGIFTPDGLAEYVRKGLRGVTSNPAIFEKAIVNSDLYDNDIRHLALEGKTTKEIYEALAISDIRKAADILRPVFEQTNGADGYVSLEVNPHLAHQTQETVDEVRRLSKAVDRPNLMIKVPSTAEGVVAVKTLTDEGYNINVTLMFSLSQYDLVTSAYIDGLAQRARYKDRLASIASVASFFVSRVDSKVDPLLDQIDLKEAAALKGKIGIANAKLAYQRFKEKFSGERWDLLTRQGARVQRVLYGSTSTKNPDYPDTLYPDNLIGPQTVNTLPPETLDAFLDHGTVVNTLESGLEEALRDLEKLKVLEIDLDDITRQLLEEGIQKFIKPYDHLIKTIAEKQAAYINA